MGPTWVLSAPDGPHVGPIQNGRIACAGDIFYYIILYSALPISCGHFSSNNSRNTPIACPRGRGMGVFCEFERWPKFYFRIACAVGNNVLYCTAIYRASIVFGRVQQDQTAITQHLIKIYKIQQPMLYNKCIVNILYYKIYFGHYMIQNRSR